MTVRDAVSQIRSFFKLLSSDNDISDRAIAAELKSTSLQLIKQETDKRKLFSSDNIFTTIPCLEMEPVPISDCCDYVSDCNIAKSKKQLPKVAENMYGLLVQGTFNLETKEKFNYIDPSRYVGLLHIYPEGKYNKKHWWIVDRYLYFNDENVEKVKFSALFEEDFNPNDFNCNCEPDPCPPNPLDVEFHCPGYLVMRCLSLVRDTMLKTYSRSTQDNTENDIDEQKTA